MARLVDVTLAGWGIAAIDAICLREWICHVAYTVLVQISELARWLRNTLTHQGVLLTLCC